MNNWCICWLSRMFLLGILIFKRLTARRLYKWFGVKRLIRQVKGLLWRAAKSAMYRDRPRKLNELKIAVTAYIRNISPADLQEVFASNIKRSQACIDVR